MTVLNGHSGKAAEEEDEDEELVEVDSQSAE